MVFPLRQGTRTSPDLYFVDIESCGSGTEILSLFLGVTGIIGELGIGIKSGGLPRGPQGRGGAP